MFYKVLTEYITKYLWVLIFYLLQENPSFDTERCSAFQCDVTKDDLSEHIALHSVDIVTLIFVLSAILPSKMDSVLSNIFKVGLILYIWPR